MCYGQDQSRFTDRRQELPHITGRVEGVVKRGKEWSCGAFLDSARGRISQCACAMNFGHSSAGWRDVLAAYNQWARNDGPWTVNDWLAAVFFFPLLCHGL